MAMLFNLFKFAHIIGGFTALLVFWIPIVTRKGGKAHRMTGWIYVYAMGIVALSALYMGIWRIAFDPARSTESVAFAWFLIFISILSSATGWYGLRVLRAKRRSGAHRHPADLAPALLLLCSGIGISLYGAAIHFPLITWFPVLGIVLGFTQLLYWLRKPKERMHWYFQHIGGMLGCCIATITAFTVFGAPRLLNLDSASLLVWFLPTIILTPVIVGMNIYYRKKFAEKSG